MISKLIARLPATTPAVPAVAITGKADAAASPAFATPQSSVPWIGVDLDGTLARHDHWQGRSVIGPPVPAMVSRVQGWLVAGHRVKIFTARASDPACVPAVRAWLAKVDLPGDLEVTCVKDFCMIELWDDRAVQVLPNRGEPVAGSRSRFPLAAPAVVLGSPATFSA